MRFRHDMPFGAALQDDGSVRFRLWAPACEQVSLVLEDSGESLPMAPEGDGWFALTTDAAGAGTRYRFVLPDGLRVADPASRFQPRDVHGPSEVVDPHAYDWACRTWRGRPWHEAVIYELHVGAFSEAGSFDGARRRLDHLAELGVTTLELMPLAEFPGRRNWGYDGVLPYAPDAAYGEPEELKRLIDAAHERGLMVMLDVVYNHFGPDGNYLHAYAPQFFDDSRHTPWGAAIAIGRREVRDFFVHNALYWLEEYRFDGLRFDAVDQISDNGTPHFLEELALTIRGTITPDRHVHLVLENDRNTARYLERDEEGQPRLFTAQWNDDYHHIAHLLLTGEAHNYYRDYQDGPLRRLARVLGGGFAYQGEPSVHRGGRTRGEPSGHLPPGAFVNFLQNHDQIGNRAFGERLSAISAPGALEAMTALLLLAPSPPLLFMGEEWASSSPFLFFCDFPEPLAGSVRDGRRREFATACDGTIPDATEAGTFRQSRLDWDQLDEPRHARRLSLYRTLLRLRREVLFPAGPTPALGDVEPSGSAAEDLLRIGWTLGDGSRLTALAKLGPGRTSSVQRPAGALLFASRPGVDAGLADGHMPGWTTAWFRRNAA
jgi:malto-oligosyltrehalose trehalohydrolase